MVTHPTFTTEQAQFVDIAMDTHMYHHSISNNIGYMSCNPGCRIEALGRAVNKAIQLADDPDWCWECQCERDKVKHVVDHLGKERQDAPPG